jgi:hypothetical protein
MGPARHSAPVRGYPRNVAPGTYYLRARAVNAFGSTVSRELPLSVPGGCLPPQFPLGFNATVGPGTVTLSWSQTITTGITFDQIFRLDSQDDVIRTVLLPPQTRSVSAPLQPGVYRVALVSGGPCGTPQALADALVFTVP